MPWARIVIPELDAIPDRTLSLCFPLSLSRFPLFGQNTQNEQIRYNTTGSSRGRK